MDDTQLMKGILEGCVLSIISEKETYGYEILTRLVDEGFSELGEGTEKIVGNLDKKEAKVERVVKELIKECEDEGIDIFEYAKRFEEASEENEVIENGEIE